MGPGVIISKGVSAYSGGMATQNYRRGYKAMLLSRDMNCTCTAVQSCERVEAWTRVQALFREGYGGYNPVRGEKKGGGGGEYRPAQGYRPIKLYRPVQFWVQPIVWIHSSCSFMMNSTYI